MPNAKILPIAVLAFALGCALHAQPLQPLEPGQIGLSLSAAATGSTKGKLTNGSTTYSDIGVTSHAWALDQRIALGQLRSLTIGLNYDLTNIDTKTSAPAPLPDRLQSLGASLRYFQPFDKQWMLSASVGAGSHVADSGLLADGWAARVSVVGIYNQSRQLTLMAGTAYDSFAPDLRIVPILGCDWRPTEKWSFAFGFPKTSATYKLNKKVALGLAVSGSGGAFLVKNDPLPGATTRSLADSKLQYLEARLGFNADWKLNDTFRLSGTVGQVLYRQVKYIDRDYKLRSRGTTPFLSLAVRAQL
jgi:hypothetical protein